MRIKCNGSIFFAEGLPPHSDGTPQRHESGLFRTNCIHLGFTEDELDRAEADPGEWIDCPCARTTNQRSDA